MPRKLIENEGTATVIISFLSKIGQVKLQALSKRSYNVILPRVLFVIKRLWRLSEPYNTITKE